MKRSIRRLCLLLLALMLLPFGAQGAPLVEEWPLPWADSRPRDPAVAPDGRIWFCAQTGNYLGVFDPVEETFDRFALPPGTFPHDLVVDPSGQVWYAGNGHIGRLDPESGTITPYPMPRPTMDPHTLALDGRGHLWFTLQQSNLVGRLELATGNLRFAAPATDQARPYGLLIDARGHPRVALFGSNRLATLGPRTLRLVETPLPDAEARPRRLTLGGEGNIWYSDYARGYLGRYSPGTGQVEEWPLPRASTPPRPYGIAADNQGRIWIADTGVLPNRLWMFDPQTARFEHSLAVPSGAGTIRRMHLHSDRNEIWFGTDRNTLGRLRPGS